MKEFLPGQGFLGNPSHLPQPITHTSEAENIGRVVEDQLRRAEVVKLGVDYSPLSPNGKVRV